MDRDRFRSHLEGEGEKDTVWRHSKPPKYDLVNEAFASGRTKEWAKGSLEEVVQNLVKSWEMELTHKVRLEDFKTIDPQKFSLSVNGSVPIPADQVLQAGSYNVLLASSKSSAYQSKLHTFESSHEVFHKVFPGGFAWEVLEVYSGPPTVSFKWRHWGQASTTGKPVEVLGVAIAKVDYQLRIGELEVFYDPTGFLEELWPRVDDTASACPLQAQVHI